MRSAEFWLAIVTTLGRTHRGLAAGILVAVMLSLVNIIYHISRPHDALLDDVDASGGTVYRGVDRQRNAADRAGPDCLSF